MASAACGTILGDFPDGQLGQGSDGSQVPPGDDTKPPPGDETSPGGPEGSICTIPNADILDMAVDGTDIFWIRTSSAPDEPGFSVEACPKTGGEVRRIATTPTQPAAFTLADKYVFWSINQDANAQQLNGVWRANKQGTAGTTLWTKLDHAAALAAAGGYLYVGETGAGSAMHIDGYLPDTGYLITQLSGPNLAIPIGIAASPAEDVFFTMGNTKEIWTMSLQTPTRFTPSVPSVPAFLTYDNGSLYWAAGGTISATTPAKCPNPSGCAVTTLATQATGFQALAVRGGGVYWTANEGGRGVLRGCPDLAKAPCENQQGKDPIWYAENAEVSRIALDDQNVFLAARKDADSYIVKHPR